MEAAGKQTIPPAHYLAAVSAVVSIEGDNVHNIVVDECTVCFALVQASRMDQHRANLHQPGAAS